jgi:hypothetical protein
MTVRHATLVQVSVHPLRPSSRRLSFPTTSGRARRPTLSRLLPVYPSGMDGELAAALASELRRGALAEYSAALAAVFVAGAERRRRQRDAIARALEESMQRLALFARGAEAFAEDEATAAVLQRHVVRGAGAEALDLVLRYQVQKRQASLCGARRDGHCCH